MTGALVCPHRELAVGWALHALEPAEEILVATHLPDCSACSHAVAEAEHVGAALGLSVPEEIPSTELEQRVLAITTTAQASPVTPPPPPAYPARPIVPQSNGRIPRTSASVPLRRPPRQRRRREPICVPETLVLISVGLLILALAFTIVFYAIP
jgi:anti-sigma factor ChrR (cupin superfamily)